MNPLYPDRYWSVLCRPKGETDRPYKLANFVVSNREHAERYAKDWAEKWDVKLVCLLVTEVGL